jgi:hypothetical protein
VRGRLLAAALLLALGARAAHAAVERHAIIVGNNHGLPEEVPLRWAESDARRMYDVLKNVGEFRPENMVLLEGESPDVVRRAIIATNDRIRSAGGVGERDALLVVYYSGHSDAEALHLGPAPFPVAELEQLVRGSAAAFRLLIVDGCRSGALTNVKGATRAPPFPIAVDQHLAGEGAVFWTSSAATEDAQESDEIRGSFFTHHLVSGLLGAADEDGDGAVVLEEAYRYAYQNTLRASSRTLAGTQHPTYRTEVRGRGGLALTRPGAAAGRATVSFPAGIGFLLFEGGRDGPVVGELGVHSVARRLSLRPGAYFVRGRGPGYLLEGTLALAPSANVAVDPGSLERIEYARLTRKGGGATAVSGPVAAFRVRSALTEGAAPCLGAALGWTWVSERLSLSARLGGCREGYAPPEGGITATASEGDAAARLSHAWDLGPVALDLGLVGSLGLLHQSYATRATAPSRTSAFGGIAASGGVDVALGRGFHAFAEAAAGSEFYRRRSSASHDTELAAPFAWSAIVGLGRY